MRLGNWIQLALLLPAVAVQSGAAQTAAASSVQSPWLLTHAESLPSTHPLPEISDGDILSANTDGILRYVEEQQLTSLSPNENILPGASLSTLSSTTGFEYFWESCYDVAEFSVSEPRLIADANVIRIPSNQDDAGAATEPPPAHRQHSSSTTMFEDPSSPIASSASASNRPSKRGVRLGSSCKSPKRKPETTNGTALSHENFKSCALCGAARNSEGKFEIPLDMFTRQQTPDERLPLIRLTVARYNHHRLADLTRTSYEALLSFQSVVNCYNVHCQGDAAEFRTRHRKWGLRTFHRFNCTGGDRCDYVSRSESRRKWLDLRRQNQKRKRGIAVVEPSDQTSPPPSNDSGDCSRCGLSRNQNGRFVLPSLRVARSSDLNAQLQEVRQQYARFNHHGRADLERSSYCHLMSWKHIVLCFDLHCGGNVAEFQTRYPKLALYSFRDVGCSGTRKCNYLEMGERRLKRKTKMTCLRRTKFAEIQQ